MDTTTCISNDNWLAYSENKLGKDALMQLEQHVLHCEMCADIKGGIDTLARAQSLKKEVAILNNTVDEYLLTKKRRTLFWLYSGIAAGLIALAFLGWMLLHPIEKETAINNLLTESPNQISI